MTLRWPFVPRFVYDDTLAQLHDERERTRYLTDLLADLKVNGASIVRRAVSEAGRLEPKPRSAVQQAIDENRYASGNPRLRAYLADRATKQLERGVLEADVVERLRTWSNVVADDEDDEDDDQVIGG